LVIRSVIDRKLVYGLYNQDFDQENFDLLHEKSKTDREQNLGTGL